MCDYHHERYRMRLAVRPWTCLVADLRRRYVCHHHTMMEGCAVLTHGSLQVQIPVLMVDYDCMLAMVYKYPANMRWEGE